MPYNKEQLFSLPPEERVALAEELWSSVEEDVIKISDDEIAFAEERLKLHQQNPNEGMSIEDLKKYFMEKHGFLNS